MRACGSGMGERPGIARLLLGASAWVRVFGRRRLGSKPLAPIQHPQSGQMRGKRW